jgi:hypothetical protein
MLSRVAKSSEGGGSRSRPLIFALLRVVEHEKSTATATPQAIQRVIFFMYLYDLVIHNTNPQK